MKHAPTPLSQDRLEALTASAVAWLLRLLGVLRARGAQPRRRVLTHLVYRMERGVECILFLKALHAFGPRIRRRYFTKPDAIPAGFRRNKGDARLFWKCAGIRARRAGLIVRVTRLLHALAHSLPHIARFMKCIVRGLHFGRLVLRAPAPDTVTATAPSAVAFADSS